MLIIGIMVIILSAMAVFWWGDSVVYFKDLKNILLKFKNLKILNQDNYSWEIVVVRPSVLVLS